MDDLRVIDKAIEMAQRQRYADAIRSLRSLQNRWRGDDTMEALLGDVVYGLDEAAYEDMDADQNGDSVGTGKYFRSSVRTLEALKRAFQMGYPEDEAVRFLRGYLSQSRWASVSHVSRSRGPYTSIHVELVDPPSRTAAETETWMVMLDLGDAYALREVQRILARAPGVSIHHVDPRRIKGWREASITVSVPSGGWKVLVDLMDDVRRVQGVDDVTLMDPDGQPVR